MHIASASTSHLLAFAATLTLLAVARAFGDGGHEPSHEGAALLATDACDSPPGAAQAMRFDGPRHDAGDVAHRLIAPTPTPGLDDLASMCREPGATARSPGPWSGVPAPQRGRDDRAR